MNAKKNTEKVRLKLPLHVYLGYLFVVTLIFSGVTFSKYIASTSAGDGARVATFGELEMTEKDKPEQFIIAPGVNIKKNPLISYAMEEKSESAAYVFVYVVAENWKFDKQTNKYSIMTGDKELMSWSVDSNWKYITGNDWYEVFCYYVPPNEKLDAVKFIKNGEITVSPELYASEYDVLASAYRTITFEAYAVQANGFGSAEHAWWELNKTVNPIADN